MKSTWSQNFVKFTAFSHVIQFLAVVWLLYDQHLTFVFTECDQQIDWISTVFGQFSIEVFNFRRSILVPSPCIDSCMGSGLVKAKVNRDPKINVMNPRNKESYFVLHHFSSHLRRYQSIDGTSISLWSAWCCFSSLPQPQPQPQPQQFYTSICTILCAAHSLWILVLYIADPNVRGPQNWLLLGLVLLHFFTGSFFVLFIQSAVLTQISRSWNRRVNEKEI